ncbi:MAG: hypothetical protein PHF82_05385, partial [Lutispora sp.]|nr:hypothetical protein [Lutispora sp.]
MKKVFTARKALCLLLIFTMLFPILLYAEDESAYTESSQQIGPGTHYKNATWVTPNSVFNINMVETQIGTKYI